MKMETCCDKEWKEFYTVLQRTEVKLSGDILQNSKALEPLRTVYCTERLVNNGA